ncbi:MAG: EamA family transporter [Hyphomicrobiales bacterium]|jgi:drug/metabolite transporter (DMT)-like permease|nr:EamA family transporter [Hyphomicrobiales bacterium]
MLGLFCAMFSAIAFAANDTALRRGILFASVYKSIIVTVPIGVPLFLMAIVIFGCWPSFHELSLNSIYLFSIAGVIHFVFGRYFGYKAIESLGSTQAGPIVQLGLLISLFFAFFVLKEAINAYHIIGISLLLLGPLFILFGKQNDKFTKSGIKLNYNKGLMWGLMCAACYGTSPFLIKLGLGSGDFKYTIIGGFVSYLSAMLFLVFIILISGVKYKDILEINPDGMKWFTITGIMGSTAQLLRYIALGILPISIVEPIHRSSVVFRVLFGYIVNRKHEIINIRVLSGIALSLIGVYILILQLDIS